MGGYLHENKGGGGYLYIRQRLWAKLERGRKREGEARNPRYREESWWCWHSWILRCGQVYRWGESKSGRELSNLTIPL
jgi:hypothetical protein